jgi:protein required for attachment to host cells
MKKPKTWALVADGERARVLSGLEGDAPGIMLDLTTEAPTRHLGEMMADDAGRSFASTQSGRRSAMEPGSDPVRRDMQDFARATFDTLEKHRRKGAFDRLAIFAAPKMLGILRDEMPPQLKDRVILEKPANLLWQADAELISGVREAIDELPSL